MRLDEDDDIYSYICMYKTWICVCKYIYIYIYIYMWGGVLRILLIDV